MNTITKTKKPLYASPIGRIWLMLKMDIISHKRQLIALVAVLFALLLFVPRIPTILTGDYIHWSTGWIALYDYGLLKNIILTIMFIAYILYINKRIYHGIPALYSTIPVGFWEKVIAIHLYGLILYTLGSLVMLGTYGIEYLISAGRVEPISWGQVLWVTDIWKSPISLPNNVQISGTDLLVWLLPISFILASYFIHIFSAIRVRNGFLSLVLSSFIIMGVMTILGAFSFQILASSETPSEMLNVTVWCVFIYFASLASGFGYVIYRRLRTVSS